MKPEIVISCRVQNHHYIGWKKNSGGHSACKLTFVMWILKNRIQSKLDMSLMIPPSLFWKIVPLFCCSVLLNSTRIWSFKSKPGAFCLRGHQVVQVIFMKMPITVKPSMATEIGGTYISLAVLHIIFIALISKSKVLNVHKGEGQRTHNQAEMAWSLPFIMGTALWKPDISREKRLLSLQLDITVWPHEVNRNLPGWPQRHWISFCPHSCKTVTKEMKFMKMSFSMSTFSEVE